MFTCEISNLTVKKIKLQFLISDNDYIKFDIGFDILFDIDDEK